MGPPPPWPPPRKIALKSCMLKIPLSVEMLPTLQRVSNTSRLILLGMVPLLLAKGESQGALGREEVRRCTRWYCCTYIGTWLSSFRKIPCRKIRRPPKPVSRTALHMHMHIGSFGDAMLCAVLLQHQILAAAYCILKHQLSTPYLVCMYLLRISIFRHNTTVLAVCMYM